MLASLVSDDGNTPLIKGWNENKLPPDAKQLAALHRRADRQDIKKMALNLGVARYIADDPFDVLRMQSTETSFNLDGIWGGNMYANAAGAILPNKITSKHNIRYQPNMNGIDLTKKIRAPDKRESLRALRDYIVARLDLLDYRMALAKGYDIGSGPTEAMCKTLTLRLKRPGMKWDRDHAAAMMNLTALYDSGQAKAYWALAA